MQRIAPAAKQIALVFEYGVLAADAVIAWADAMIVESDIPPDSLIELSLTDPSRTADFISLLNQLSADAEFWPAMKSAIPRIKDFVVKHPESAEGIANHLFRAACEFPVSEVPDDLQFIYSIDDAFSLAHQGIYGEPEAVLRDFIEEMEKF